MQASTSRFHRLAAAFYLHQGLHFSVKFLSTANKVSSFALDYLKNSIGMSQESALKASKYLKNMNSSHKPDSVIEFFTAHSFSKSQISDLVKRHPAVLLADPEKSILPKIEFFKAKGLSDTDVAKMFTGYPAITRRSLEKQIVPAYDYFKGVLGSDELVHITIKRFMGLLTYKLEDSYIPNIELLRKYGVPDQHLHTFLRCQPRVLLSAPASLEEAIKKVLLVGLDPLRQNFIVAVFVRRCMSEQTWQRKLEAYKKWGWSEEMVLRTFRTHPWCMATGEDKITAIMDFLVNKMGWDAVVTSKYPSTLSMSLKKRLIPRGSVIKVLIFKGLVKKITNRSLFGSTEKYFLERFLIPYKEEVPGLLELYEGKKAVEDILATKDCGNTGASCCKLS